MVLNTLSEYVIRSTSGRGVISCPMLQCAQGWSAKMAKEVENTKQINDSNPILLWLYLCTSRFPQARAELSKVFLTVLGLLLSSSYLLVLEEVAPKSHLCFF